MFMLKAFLQCVHIIQEAGSTTLGNDCGTHSSMTCRGAWRVGPLCGQSSRLGQQASDSAAGRDHGAVAHPGVNSRQFTTSPLSTASLPLERLRSSCVTPLPPLLGSGNLSAPLRSVKTKHSTYQENAPEPTNVLVVQGLSNLHLWDP